jgi:hypothetical protein
MGQDNLSGALSFYEIRCPSIMLTVLPFGESSDCLEFILSQDQIIDTLL